MKTVIKEIIGLISELHNLRKNPILLLILEDIDRGTSLHIQDVLIDKNFETLDVIIHTPGGDIDAAFNIVKLIREASKKVNMIVPFFAKSAGTLITISGDSILMAKLAELGPLDTQIKEDQEGGPPKYNSALNGFKALEQVQIHALEAMDIATKLIIRKGGLKVSEAITLATNFAGSTSGILYRQLNPKKIGEYARALEIGERYGIMILTRYLGWKVKKAEIAIKTLVKAYPSHSFVIDDEELKQLGFNADKLSINEEKIVHQLRKKFLEVRNNFIQLYEGLQKNENNNIEAKNEQV